MLRAKILRMRILRARMLKVRIHVDGDTKREDTESVDAKNEGA
jgi:hypothetical protein